MADATAFIATTCPRGTTSGSAADRPDETNRVKPLTINAPNRIGRSPAPAASSVGDREHQHQPAQVGADQNQPPVPAVQQRAGERAEHRVRQVQHGEGACDLPRAGGPFGVEQKPARQSGLEQAVAELADRPQFEQPPEFGQAAHRPPEGDRCASVGHGNHVLLWGSTSAIGNPTHSTNIPAGRACSPRRPRRWCHDGGVAQSEDPEDYVAPAAHRVRAGTLLLANTDLLEPTFRRSVIYVVEHNDGGTLGVVLNRPSDTAVYNVLPQWAKLATKPKTMFIGGPVKRDAALCLATLRVGTDPDGVPGLRHVQGRMVMVDLDAEPETIAPVVEGVRIFAGYSGWTIGQLEGEIERDDWIVLSALPSDVLVEPRVDLWARVLRRQPLPLSLLASHPIDISRN